MPARPHAAWPLLVCLLALLPGGGRGAATFPRVGPEMSVEERRWPVKCSAQYAADEAVLPGCTPEPGGACDRRVADGFLTPQEVAALIDIAERGMALGHARPLVAGGPTILDVNGGWVLHAGAETPNMLLSSSRPSPFTPEDLVTYRNVTTRLKSIVMETFGLETLFFTVPTFITREAASEVWKPTTMHDEYWHPHVDKNSSDHYDFSGLVYLSTQGVDFTGGSLFFYPQSSLDCSPYFAPDPGPCKVIGDPELEVAPAAGRLITFGSGYENSHGVTRVETGTRYVLSFWFTCDRRREVAKFLDGRAHKHNISDDADGAAAPKAKAKAVPKGRRRRNARNEGSEL
eukprot:NODE_7766_length_1552_cov_4.470175.p1 GENE.NODE_7766_length_1552_cov_4.470175~~NODE_7766_length_1552_cov_4.470175.p1  ORF type:complete len:345 (+),score=88.80 NODE_7766_length_1552_cov_4.470175:111-1145(+)